MAGESAYLVRGCWKVACEDRLLFSLWYPFQVAAPNVLVGILRSIFGRLFLFEAFACNIQTVKTWMREQEGDGSLGILVPKDNGVAVEGDVLSELEQPWIHI